MRDFNSECDETIEMVQRLLTDNPEWKERYRKYSRKILEQLNTMKMNKELLNERAPLYFYINVNQAKSQMRLSLRYLGQDVATIRAGEGKVTISTTGFDLKNGRDFNCGIQLKDTPWKATEASKFRSHFSGHPKRTNNSGKKKEEHRLESPYCPSS
ncbi:MAG: hypothetical protein WA705_18650 [Candidatus Ozemobacteraceae bacterium]